MPRLPAFQRRQLLPSRLSASPPDANLGLSQTDFCRDLFVELAKHSRYLMEGQLGTEVLGNTQPLDGSTGWNPDGYVWLGAVRATVQVDRV